MSRKQVAIAYFGGQVFTRQTNRRYEFVVVGLIDRAQFEAQKIAQAEDAERRNWQYWSDMSKGNVETACDGDVALVIEKVTLGLEASIAKRVKEVRSWIEKEAQDGRFSRYAVQGWCSRRELAEKTAARVCGKYADVRIVPVCK